MWSCVLNKIIEWVDKSSFVSSITHIAILGDGSHVLANIDVLPSPRIISTHLPWDLLPARVRNGHVKVIFNFFSQLTKPRDHTCTRVFEICLGCVVTNTIVIECPTQ